MFYTFVDLFSPFVYSVIKKRLISFPFPSFISFTSWLLCGDVAGVLLAGQFNLTETQAVVVMVSLPLNETRGQGKALPPL